MSENIVPFTARPPIRLRPDYRLREPCPQWRDRIKENVDAADAVLALMQLPRFLNSRLHRSMAYNLLHELLTELLHQIDLRGLEYRDGRGELIGKIIAESEINDEELPAPVYAHTDTGEVIDVRDLAGQLPYRRYVCLPGGSYVCLPDSKLHGESAIIEAARARLGEAAA